MCLDVRVAPSIEKREISRIPPNKGIKVYKVVYLPENKNAYEALHVDFTYKKGVNTASSVTLYSNYQNEYESGFHFYKTKKAAEEYRKIFEDKHLKVITCRVKKSWITAIGSECNCHFSARGPNWWKGQWEKVIVAKKAIFPAPPKFSAKKKPFKK